MAALEALNRFPKLRSRGAQKRFELLSSTLQDVGLRVEGLQGLGCGTKPYKTLNPQTLNPKSLNSKPQQR